MVIGGVGFPRSCLHGGRLCEAMKDGFPPPFSLGQALRGNNVGFGREHFHGEMLAGGRGVSAMG